MAEKGWRKSKSDVCIYIKVVDGNRVFVIIWVDDGVMFAVSEKVIAAEIEILHLVFELVKMGRPQRYLSLEFEYTNHGTFMHQTRYITSTVEKFEPIFGGPLRPRSTPMDLSFSPLLDSPKLDDDKITTYQ